MKIAQRGLDIELRKKFQDMELNDFYELASKVTKYEELLDLLGNLIGEVNYEEIVVADLLSISSFICPLQVKKAPDLWKKSHTSDTQVQYTFDVVKTEEIFLQKEKFITFPHDHQLPTKRNSGKKYTISIITP